MDTERLRRRADFLAAATGVKAHAQSVILQAYERGDEGPSRVGFTVSKKVGNAVERNRVRRRLREAVRVAAKGRMRRGTDYVVIGRREAIRHPFDRLVADLAGAFERTQRGARTVQPDPRRGDRRSGKAQAVNRSQ